jgi:hypothetical protein
VERAEIKDVSAAPSASSMDQSTTWAGVVGTQVT